MSGALVSYTIAAVVLLLLWKFGDRIRVPKWLSVEYLFYGPVYRTAVHVIEDGISRQAVAKQTRVGDIIRTVVVAGLILVVFLAVRS